MKCLNCTSDNISEIQETITPVARNFTPYICNRCGYIWHQSDTEIEEKQAEQSKIDFGNHWD